MEAVVRQELVTRDLLACAQRAEPSLPEPVLDGSAAAGVAVQGVDWVNHLLMGDRAHKGLWHCIVLIRARVAAFHKRQAHGGAMCDLLLACTNWYT